MKLGTVRPIIRELNAELITKNLVANREGAKTRMDVIKEPLVERVPTHLKVIHPSAGEPVWPSVLQTLFGENLIAKASELAGDVPTSQKKISSSGHRFNLLFPNEAVLCSVPQGPRMEPDVNAFVEKCKDLAFFSDGEKTPSEDDPVVVAQSLVCVQKGNRYSIADTPASVYTRSATFIISGGVVRKK